MLTEEEFRLDKELIDIEEKKQVAYSYKKMKLQHHTLNGVTQHISLITGRTDGGYGNNELKYNPEEAMALLSVLKTIFSDDKEG